MKMLPGCIPCLVKMAITTATIGGGNEEQIYQSARSALKILLEGNFQFPAPYFSAPILRKVETILNQPDPFIKQKRVSNQAGLKLAQELAKPYVEKAKNSKDRLLRSLRASIAGNIADYAVVPDLEGKIEDKLREAFKLKFSCLDFERFWKKLRGARRILYICDNAGEIAFDRILIEELSNFKKQVIVAVKSGPALNDALVSDALEVGLDKIAGVELITTGQAMMGLDLKSAGRELKRAFRDSDIILAKGQANFECLAGKNGKIFFLTLIKCQALENKLGLKKGSAIFASGDMLNAMFGNLK